MESENTVKEERVQEIRGGDVLKLVTFEVADEFYGFPIQMILEIIKFTAITPAPGSFEIVEGVINLRGDIIPVIDIRKPFGLPVQSDRSKSKILITEVETFVFGIIVDSVKEVTSITWEEFHAPPMGMTSTKNQFVIAVQTQGEQMLQYMDLKQILRSDALMKEFI